MRSFVKLVRKLFFSKFPDSFIFRLLRNYYFTSGIAGENTDIANGELVEEINKLKNQNGKDIIVYGGGTFVTALINAGLIDEFHLFINPTAIGNGMTIFKALDRNLNLKLKIAKQFDCGITLTCYELDK